MKLYVYCLAEQIDTPSTAITGIAGAKVDILNWEGFSLLVSEFDVNTATRARDALAHDAAVRSVLDQTTPLPLRFGTVLSEEQLRSYVSARRESLRAKLAEVRGCLEMSVKIIGNADQEETDANSEMSGPGARFLKDKQRRAAQAKEVSEWLHGEVADFVRQEQVSLGPTEKLIVAAAHLVEREHLPEYRDGVGKARQMRPELHFLLSGPWPPYSFSNIDLEFKTRFGVS
jgi:gas vesicle protein GvpL/GvpF